MSNKTVTKNKPCLLEEIYEWVETFVTALVAVVLIFTFVMRIVAVSGDSMNQTLQNRDTLVISNIVPPKSGDIVVFQLLEEKIDENTKMDEHINDGPLIKRIIATEGQTVDIDFATWTVTVDGVKLDEPYVNYENTVMRSNRVKFPYTVEPGKVFVMGDNRNHSADSRYFGTIDKRHIMGKVLIRLSPLDKIGVVKPVTE